MLNKMTDPRKPPFQPFVFVLKEGKEIRKDFLDYSLVLIQVYHTEVIRTPTQYT